MKKNNIIITLLIALIIVSFTLCDRIFTINCYKEIVNHQDTVIVLQKTLINELAIDAEEHGSDLPAFDADTRDIIEIHENIIDNLKY